MIPPARHRLSLFIIKPHDGQAQTPYLAKELTINLFGKVEILDKLGMSAQKV